MLEDLKKASEITKKVKREAEKLLKPGESIYNIAETIEQKIIDLGGFPSFPVNISINNIAAHYTPTINDNIILKDGDVVKFDFGAQVNGYCIDTAFTVEINDNKYKDLIEASRNALENVKKILRKDIEISEIGKVIENTIKSYNYNPIYNLSGHKIDRYILHSKITIPNYDNKSKIKLNEGIYAIEPFATNGVGFVKEGKPSGIYSIISDKPIRDPNIKKFFQEIYNKYKTLPFAYRWLYKEYNDKINLKLFIEYLKKNGNIYEYPILVEQSNGIVTQFETTFYIYDRVYDMMD
ncbi:type II methionyl aminopeptidase [Candidatus Nanobsidianus stetteri]|uniref:Methionine aminopeptidase n=1 Tax=Nanobsidianus stetteri TaxID=1294122 RepID=A0A2T9WL27_NANST|nr:type II methionyl aminopeptidase [Candidatus Nanobsidianus stetteri]MCC5447273.1 type II methionyl aminopeptidase [Candidatus Nanobsidianus stetteri]